MIEPAQGPAPAEPPMPPRAEPAQEPPPAELPPQSAGSPQPVADPVLNVRLDGETLRLYTELRDPQTDRVLLRLPAAYEPGEARREDSASFEA